MTSTAFGNSAWDGKPADAAAVRIEQLQFRWPGKQSFGIHISELSIRVGERVLLMGPSGGGKTTLLSLICGIALPEAGHLSILGQPTRDLTGPRRDRFRADHFGIIFQMFNLVPFASVADNVRLPLSFSSLRRRRIGEAGRIDAEVARLLDVLDIPTADYAHRPASALSVGQQQRVAAARALIGAPDIIVADEPTSALDGERQKEFLDLLFNQLASTGSTLILASHDERIAHRFDRVLPLTSFLRRLA